MDINDGVEENQPSVAFPSSIVQMAPFYGPPCTYVELTWLEPPIHCVFAVMLQTEEVRLTASYTQGEEMMLGYDYGGCVIRVERKPGPSHSYITLH